MNPRILNLLEDLEECLRCIEDDLLVLKNEQRLYAYELGKIRKMVDEQDSMIDVFLNKQLDQTKRGGD